MPHPGTGVDARATIRSEHDVLGFVTRTCFKTGPPGRVGIESEWFLHDPADPGRYLTAPDLERLAAALTPLPASSLLSFEPGGQLELSTRCAGSLAEAPDLLRTDLSRVDDVLARAGLRRVGTGVDQHRLPRRLRRTPRYDAMETYFDALGPGGRAMMSTTAAVQVCLDAGADPADVRHRWAVLRALTPVLVAAFANSPVQAGRRTGWRSTRARIWADLDPARTAWPAGDDPVEAWARFALDAPVMAVADPTGRWLARPGCTFGRWVDGVTGLPAPTEDDLALHLSTLFPPVRPHGWLELRMVDALPDAHWPVAVAVATALVEDPRAADAALDATAGLRAGAARTAARLALRDPVLRTAATACFAAALDALPRLGAAPDLKDLVGGYADHYVATGRTPADDLDGDM